MSNRSNKFICSFDCNGFECIVDVTSWEKQSLLDSIAGEQLRPAPVNLNHLMLRARFNQHRNPEIYSFTTTEDLTEESLWEFAEENPQALADLIRKNGNHLYGGRPPKEEPRIK